MREKTTATATMGVIEINGVIRHADVWLKAKPKNVLGWLRQRVRSTLIKQRTNMWPKSRWLSYQIQPTDVVIIKVYEVSPSGEPLLTENVAASI